MEGQLYHQKRAISASAAISVLSGIEEIREKTAAVRLADVLKLAAVTKSLTKAVIAEPNSMNYLLKHVCDLTAIVINEKVALIMEYPNDKQLFKALAGII